MDGGVLSFPAQLWVHNTLQKRWSAASGSSGSLIAEGPYRRVRHPMFASIPFFHRAAGKEEAAMIERFDGEYREYMKRTGRFFPGSSPDLLVVEQNCSRVFTKHVERHHSASEEERLIDPIGGFDVRKTLNLMRNRDGEVGRDIRSSAQLHCSVHGRPVSWKSSGDTSRRRNALGSLARSKSRP